MQAEKNLTDFKLYWSPEHERHWIAFSPESGFVLFPAEVNGWTKRRPYSQGESRCLREVHLRHAFNTGLPVEWTEL